MMLRNFSFSLASYYLINQSDKVVSVCTILWGIIYKIMEFFGFPVLIRHDFPISPGELYDTCE